MPAGGDEGARRPKAKLIETERERLVDFVTSATIGLHWVGPDGTILWANPADYQLLGYTADEYIGKNIAEFHAREDVISDMLARLERGERLHEYPAALRCKDGSVRHVRITSSGLFDESGDFLNTRCFTRDVTEEIRAETRIRVLAEASELLASSLDYEATLSTLARSCVPEIADWCSVEIVEAGGRTQLAVAHVDPEKVEQARELRRRYPPDPESPRGVSQVLRTGTPVMGEIADSEIAAVARDPEHERLLRSLGLRSYLIAPIALRGRILGALTLVNAEAERCFGPADLEMTQELASRAAQAIENARLYRDAQQARREAEAAADRLAVLARLGEAIAESLEPDRALQQLARLAVQGLADYAVAYRLEDGAVRRAALAHADPDRQPLVEELVQAGPPALDDSYGAGAVLRTGEAMMVSDIPEELLERATQNGTHLELVRRLAPRSSIIVPLAARGRTLGALALATTDHSGKRYDQDDLTFAQEMANRAALLVDNARLFFRAQEATRARDEMLSVVSHDLRNLLGTMTTAIDLLELDPPEDRRARTRASLRRAANQMSKLLDDLLDVAQIEAGKLALSRKRFELGSLFAEILSLHGPVAEYQGIRIDRRLPGARFEIDADRNRLAQALSNLVDNALKFTPEGGQVTMAAELDGGEVRISVSDTGPGIPPEKLPHLFDRFWRADLDANRGTGLGLTIARGIVEAHGGVIQVASHPGEGTRFTLVLPR